METGYIYLRGYYSVHEEKTIQISDHPGLSPEEIYIVSGLHHILSREGVFPQSMISGTNNRNILYLLGYLLVSEKEKEGVIISHNDRDTFYYFLGYYAMNLLITATEFSDLFSSFMEELTNISNILSDAGNSNI